MAFGLPAFLLIVCMFFGAVFLILLSLVIAYHFHQIALAKGHYEKRWFWLCFLLGLPGWLMVAALPDLKLREVLPTSNIPPDEP